MGAAQWWHVQGGLICVMGRFDFGGRQSGLTLLMLALPLPSMTFHVSHHGSLKCMKPQPSLKCNRLASCTPPSMGAARQDLSPGYMVH